MDFDKFGVISHTKETKAADFATYLEKGQVMATRCEKCEEIYFPPQVDCPKCIDSNMEWVEIKGNGKLITFSTIHYGPQGFEDMAPYTVGVSEFDKGVKVFSMLSKDIKTDDIKTGMPLKVAAIELPDGRVSYEFKSGN